MAAERRGVEMRRGGQLRKALGPPILPGETTTGLDGIGWEDRELAEAGLVELRDAEGNVGHKRVDDLEPGDRADRARAEGARVRWITERVNKLREQRTRRPT